MRKHSVNIMMGVFLRIMEEADDLLFPRFTSTTDFQQV